MNYKILGLALIIIGTISTLYFTFTIIAVDYWNIPISIINGILLGFGTGLIIKGIRKK